MGHLGGKPGAIFDCSDFDTRAYRCVDDRNWNVVDVAPPTALSGNEPILDRQV
jgi:hypothetical protein